MSGCSFQSSYPSWEPSVQGKQFLANLRSFREQSLRGTNIGHGHTPIIWQENSNPMDAGHRNTGPWRNTPHNNTFGFHLASLWPVDEDQRTHTYILDWYHHCRCHSSSNPARSNPTELVEVVEQQDGELWIPTNLTCEEDRDKEEYWHAHTHDDRLRSQLGASTSTPFYKDPLGSQLDASTSTPFFNDSVQQHHDSVHRGQPTRSHWRARTDTHGCQTQTSFMEPPNFTRYQPDNHNGNFSERSMEEEEWHFDWKGPPRSWRTAYYADDDDLEAGGSINLHFDDVYPESPAVYRERPSL